MHLEEHEIEENAKEKQLAYNNIEKICLNIENSIHVG
jgi:hypothetical protein